MDAPGDPPVVLLERSSHFLSYGAKVNAFHFVLPVLYDRSGKTPNREEQSFALMLAYGSCVQYVQIFPA
jgi:hypothetical protein